MNRAGRADDERTGPAPLAPVQARRDESPCLVEHPRGGQKDGCEHGQLDPDDRKDLHGLDLGQPGIWDADLPEGIGRGLADDEPELVGKDQAEKESHANAGEGLDDARPQLLEVFEEGHAEHLLLFFLFRRLGARGRGGGLGAAAGCLGYGSSGCGFGAGGAGIRLVGAGIRFVIEGSVLAVGTESLFGKIGRGLTFLGGFRRPL
jgi:hypothetical protein